MRIVKSIEVIDVPDNPWPIDRYNCPPMVECYDPIEDVKFHETFAVVHEMIRGRRYCNTMLGQDLVIGHSAEVATLIGLPLDAFETEKESHQLIVGQLKNEMGCLRKDLIMVTAQLYVSRQRFTTHMNRSLGRRFCDFMMDYFRSL